MTPQRRQFGGIRKLPSGRFQATYWTDGEQYAMTFKTKTDAGAWLSTIQADLLRGVWIDRRTGLVTFRDYSGAWVRRRTDDVRRPLAPTTLAKYRRLLDAYLLSEFGDCKLVQVSPGQVESWYSRIAKLHPSTAAGAYRLLSTIFNSAIRKDKLISQSPCQIEGAGRERAPERPTATPAEVTAALLVTPAQYRVALMLAAWCQLRRSEILGLQRRDIDLETGGVSVNRTWLVTSEGTTVEGPPKTEAGRRTVYMPPNVLEAMERHLEQFTSSAESAWLFEYGNKPLAPRTFERVWVSARKKAGLRPDLRLHDLRHSGLTWAATTGATVAELMRQAGLTKFVGAHEARKVALSWKDRRDRPRQSCYYATL